jgi:hypothetical protein
MLVELAFALSACTARPASARIDETGDAASFAPQEVVVAPDWD